jgi:hypothetical protein
VAIPQKQGMYRMTPAKYNKISNTSITSVMGQFQILVVVHFEKWLILVPLYSVLSVYSVVLACKITTEYTENTEKTRNKKGKNQ